MVIKKKVLLNLFLFADFTWAEFGLLALGL